jgi:hypothetical protein
MWTCCGSGCAAGRRLPETDPRFAFLLAGEIACVMARWSVIAVPVVWFAQGLVWSWDRHERVEE